MKKQKKEDLKEYLEKKTNKIIDIIQKKFKCDYIPEKELIDKDFRDFLKDRDKFISYETSSEGVTLNITFFAKNPKPYYLSLVIHNLFEVSIEKISHSVYRHFKVAYDNYINDEN